MKNKTVQLEEALEMVGNYKKRNDDSLNEIKKLKTAIKFLEIYGKAFDIIDKLIDLDIEDSRLLYIIKGIIKGIKYD